MPGSWRIDPTGIITIVAYCYQTVGEEGGEKGQIGKKNESDKHLVSHQNYQTAFMPN